MPRVDPVVAVIAFVVLGTAVIWGIIQWAGPGRPSDPAVLASVTVPVLIALVFGWFLSRSEPD